MLELLSDIVVDVSSLATALDDTNTDSLEAAVVSGADDTALLLLLAGMLDVFELLETLLQNRFIHLRYPPAALGNTETILTVTYDEGSKDSFGHFCPSLKSLLK